MTERSVPNTNKRVGVNGLLYACAGLTTHTHHTHAHTRARMINGSECSGLPKNKKHELFQFQRLAGYDTMTIFNFCC